MKIAVTAASGKLGAEIVKATVGLVGSEHVIGVARTPSNAQGLGVEIRKGDYSNTEELEAAFDAVDTVLLVSGMDHPDKRIGQHRNVIESAKSAGVKKIVYTSVQGAEENTNFSPIVQSNRQTEEDIRNSNLQWAIGRNGIYIEPDVEYIESYKKVGTIVNCAGDGKCGYTTRRELGYAYACLLTDERHNGHIYNLHGEPLTQYQLADYLNKAFNTNLTYRAIGVEEFRKQSVAELGEFIGNVIGGIYQGFLEGKANNPSHFSDVAGRPHQSWEEYFAGL